MTAHNSKRWSRNLPAVGTVRKILVMRWSAMGDVALASASFEDLRKAFPEAQLHLNTLPPWDRLFANDPRFTKIIALKLRSRGQQCQALLKWLRHVKQEQYDLIVDLQCTDRSRMMLGLLWLYGCQAPYRIGNARRFPYNIAPADLPEPVHALVRNRRALQAAGIPANTSRPVLYPGTESRQSARKKCLAAGLQPGRYAVFLPGCQAAGYLKR